MELLSDLKAYIATTQPLGVQECTLIELGSGEYNCNYLLESRGKKLVVRVSVSQLSSSHDQLQHEYDVLQYLRGKQIAPEAYYIDMTGFRYPLLIEEYFEGQTVTSFDHETLTEIGSLIARLNNVQIIESHPFETRQVDYAADIAVQRRIYSGLKANQYSELWFKNTQTCIDAVTRMLADKVVSVKPMLIRRDANPNNFIMTRHGMRLIDWEITRIDDPTITLASFINEVCLYDVLNVQPTETDMVIVKRAFLDECPIANFDGLLESRLLIERLGGLVWALERMDNLVKSDPAVRDHEQKLAWYRKVASRSFDALTQER